VGNLSVGGSGKSPMVMYLMGLLLDDYEAGVLSRGYGRKTQGYYMVNYDSNFRMVGDEAMQLFQRFKNRIAIGVCENRVMGAERLIEEAGLQVLVLDDSYQHRAIQAGFNILLTDYSDPYFFDYLLPAGNLRESRAGADRADIIMVTKCPKDLTEEKKFYFISKIKPKKHQKVFFSSIDYDEEITSTKVKMPGTSSTRSPFLVSSTIFVRPVLSPSASFTVALVINSIFSFFLAFSTVVGAALNSSRLCTR